jgi:hypothetical protein
VSAPAAPEATRNVARWLLLGLVLGAFAHVVIALGLKDLWWDESLSLQRAESSLWPLLRGLLLFKDGITEQPTIDQHPFFFFLLQGILIRAAGDSEFVLRFVSAMAATLLVPTIYVTARFFVRAGVLPTSAPLWAALMAAISPYFLWYGQEARPYALWAMMALLSTYLLLRSVALDAPQRLLRGWRVGYVAVLVAFLATHYYAIFLLPVHALMIYVAARRHSRKQALLLAAGLLLAGAVVGLTALWLIMRQGGGGNFASIQLGILLPDLLNAFSLGLSVDLDKVRWLNYVFGGVVLVGSVWMVWARSAEPNLRWVVVAALVTPVIVLYLVNLVRPAYMNARHLSLSAGFFILLVGAGLSVIQSHMRGGRIAAVVLALLFAGGSAYSTFNYYSDERYGKDDFSRLGEYMDGRMMAGDAVVYLTPAAWRIFDYYAPLDDVRTAIAEGAPMALYGAPLLDPNRERTFPLLEELGNQHQRIWIIKSGTFGYMDPDGAVEAWLREHFLLVRDAEFYSGSSLRTQLYLPQIPVYEAAPPGIQFPTAITFGDQVRLEGYAIDAEIWAAGGYGLPLPVTLYWQAVNATPERRYKYNLSLIAPGEGAPQLLGSTEREPYEGDIPTTFWDPGKIIAEYVELRAAPLPAAGQPVVLTLRMYDAETLQPLVVTDSGGNELLDDGFTVVLPLAQPATQPATQPADGARP